MEQNDAVDRYHEMLIKLVRNAFFEGMKKGINDANEHCQFSDDLYKAQDFLYKWQESSAKKIIDEVMNDLRS